MKTDYGTARPRKWKITIWTFVYKLWLSLQSKFFQVVLQSFSSIAWKEKSA